MLVYFQRGNEWEVMYQIKTKHHKAIFREGLAFGAAYTETARSSASASENVEDSPWEKTNLHLFSTSHDRRLFKYRLDFAR